MAKRTIKDLNIIDDFFANAIATSTEYAKPCFRRILSVLLDKEIGDIEVKAQSIIQGDDTELRGIRLDVEITESIDDTATIDDTSTIYDIEPHLRNNINFPKHNRYYQAKIDGRYVASGIMDFSKLHDLYVITITNFDIFNEDYMIYTFKQTCIEVPQIEYEDGVRFLYFNTKGTRGGNEAISNMLKYIEHSEQQNAIDEATIEISQYVEDIKNQSKERYGLMTVGDRLYLEREEGRMEGLLEGQYNLLYALVNEGELTIQSAANRLNITEEEFRIFMLSHK